MIKSLFKATPSGASMKSLFKSLTSTKVFDADQLDALKGAATDSVRKSVKNNSLDRLKSQGVFSEKMTSKMSDYMDVKKTNVTKAANDLKVAQRSGDPDQIQKAARKLDVEIQRLEIADTSLAKFADGIDDATLKKLTKLTDDAAENSTKSKNWCMKNGNFKSCVRGAVGAAVGAYYSLEAYNDLEEDKKQCLDLCFPDDYREAVKNGRTPTYKTESAVSPFDPEVKYAILYPDLADSLCTRENMTKLGVTECDSFCKVKCDYDLDDFFAQVAENASEDVGNVLSRGLQSMFGDHWKIIVLVVLCVLLLAIPLVLKISMS